MAKLSELVDAVAKLKVIATDAKTRTEAPVSDPEIPDSVLADVAATATVVEAIGYVVPDTPTPLVASADTPSTLPFAPSAS